MDEKFRQIEIPKGSEEHAECQCLHCRAKPLVMAIQEILIQYGEKDGFGLVEISYALSWLSTEGVRQINQFISESQSPILAMLLNDSDEETDNGPQDDIDDGTH